MESVTVRIIVQNPVPGVWGAIQQGHGSAAVPYELIKSPEGTLQWDVPLTLRNGKPSGVFVQKDSKGSFVYILWGASAGQHGTEVRRRAKIYLPAGDFPGEHARWSVEIGGRAKDGWPACAAIRPSRDWQPE